MSYLDPLRLSFHGDFQADVCTVNNDVRHYDNATFEERFQAPSAGDVENGWWHPTGSNAFRLLNCRVRAVHMADGIVVRDPNVDAAAGAAVGGSNQRVSAKVVDLDPQWQLATQIWGLDVRLVDAQGTTLVRGSFEAAAFRDILFGRQANASLNGQGASSMFQSVLTQVVWAPDEALSRSPFLIALKQATHAGQLSIRLTTLGYFTRADHPRFTLGTMSGAIGPAPPSEPRSFVAGRRFAPAQGVRTAENVNFFDGRLTSDHRTALLDLSNALPLSNPAGGMTDLGAIDLVALNSEGLAEGQAVQPSQIVTLAANLPYRTANWLADSGGIHSAPLDAAQSTAAAQKPWALVRRAPGQPPRVMIRETSGGFHVRCEDFVQRLDAGDDSTASFVAVKLGRPLAGQAIAVSLVGPLQGIGGGDPDAPQQPTAPIPAINVPANAVAFTSPVTTDAQGRASVVIHTNALGDVRGYLDGQIYLLTYELPAVPTLVRHQFDFVILHVRSSFDEPAAPAWTTDVGPILSQFGNLYPVMDRNVVDLTSYDSVARERAIITLALSLPIEDPNYMPTTRDLSRGKVRTLLKWLTERDANGRFVLRHGPSDEAVPVAAGRIRPAEALEHVAPASPLAKRIADAQLAKGRGSQDD